VTEVTETEVTEVTETEVTEVTEVTVVHGATKVTEGERKRSLAG
jgi:hypothetical protein